MTGSCIKLVRKNKRALLASVLLLLCSCGSEPIRKPAPGYHPVDNSPVSPPVSDTTESPVIHSTPQPLPPRVPLPPDPIPREEPRSRYGNPESYNVFGITYHVLDSAEGFVERGVASWYGPDFHGKRTSSGEAYDMNIMTAAHKILPLPCYVKVTNLDNGKYAIVRVNDRGPFVKGRITDLSYAAARKLGIDLSGTANVEIRALNPREAVTAHGDAAASPSPVGGNTAGTKASATTTTNTMVPGASNTAISAGWYVQVGAFSRRDTAAAMVEKVRPMVGYPVVIQNSDNHGKVLYRVRVGPLANREIAEKVQDHLEDRDIDAPGLVAP